MLERRLSAGIAAALLIAASGCSTTANFRATGGYTIDDSGVTQHYPTLIACEAADPENCEDIVFTWRTETYCGIYGGRPDRITDLVLRIGGSNSALLDWEVEGGSVVLMGGDLDFELASGEPNELGLDLECGVFDPPVELLQIGDGDAVGLRIQCRATARNIILMPPSDTPYTLNVQLTGIDNVLLGCNR